MCVCVGGHANVENNMLVTLTERGRERGRVFDNGTEVQCSAVQSCLCVLVVQNKHCVVAMLEPLPSPPHPRQKMAFGT